MMRPVHRLTIAACAMAIAACAPCPVAQPAPAPAVPPTPAPFEPSRVQPADTGVIVETLDSVRVVQVQIRTTYDGASGVFVPRVVHARRGDVVRFRMADGDAAHNVMFSIFRDRRRDVPLPADSPYMTQKGQTWDMSVDLPPGSYEFACAPHFPMDQRGVLIVEP
jgi:plastocyanin